MRSQTKPFKPAGLISDQRRPPANDFRRISDINQNKVSPEHRQKRSDHRDSRVIAINSAILATIDGNQSFGGSNFGVPIKVAYELLQTYDKDKAANHP